MLNVAREAALEAGKFLKYNLGKVKHIERKQGQETNLVTEIDKQSEALIIKKIKQHYPSHDILAEESGKHNVPSDTDGSLTRSTVRPITHILFQFFACRLALK